MRIIAAIPACGLLCGCAMGVAWPELPISLLITLLLIAFAVAAGGVACGATAFIVASVAVGATAAGVVLAERAWEQAWRSSLRMAFESIAHDERQALLRRGFSPPADDRIAVVLVGVLRDDAALTDDGGVSLRVGVRAVGRAASSAADPAANPVSGDVSLTVVGDLGSAHRGEWRRGRMIRAHAQLRRPSRYLDPGVADSERALARRGLSLVGTVKSAGLVDVVARGSWYSEATASVRAFSRLAIDRAVGRWSQPAAAIVTAIVIGDRTGLDADVQRRLQEAGTYHVIAISGGNIAILAGMAVAVFRLAGLLGRTAMVSAIAGLLAYGSLVSGGASVDRATFMAVVYFAGRALDLRGPPFNTLALVAGALVVVNPLAVADPAFLLTFGASTAIMIASQAPPPTGADHVGWRLLRPVAALGLASLAAEVVLFPISATIFSRVTVAGLLLNFAAIPLMAVAQIAGMLVVPLFLCSASAATAVGAVAALGAEGLVRTARLVDVVPQVTWRVAAPAALAVALYYATLATWWVLRDRRLRFSGTAEAPAARVFRRGAATLAIAAAAWILIEPSTWWSAGGDGRLHVTFIDVGQGDSALVRFPNGQSLLVDAGGGSSTSSFDVGERVVGQVLRTLGVRRLDMLVLTHGDRDHLGGAVSVVREFRPTDVWEGIPVPSSLALQEVRSETLRARGRWTQVQTADETLVGEVRVVVLHPGPAEWERQDVRNDDSIVVELRWRDVSIVLTGDVGREVEGEIAAGFEPAPLRVIKVPHHGSLTSSSGAFLEQLRPQIAVISVGRSNTFGHPAPAVVKRYDEIGAAVYRTDRDGAITIDTDGTTLNVRTFVELRHRPQFIHLSVERMNWPI